MEKLSAPGKKVGHMLRNNNRAVIKRMAKTSLKSNRQKNLVMLAAVVLSAFMLFSVLTAGITYFQMWRLQNLRLQGGEYDAIMYGCSDEQMKMLQENKDVTEIGIVSIAGSIVETEKTDLSEIMLLWEDDTSWNVMGRNARTSLKGNYPVKENEVMVTKKALKEGGLLDYGIGDSFRATWLDGNGKKRTMEFVISGIWESGYELSNPNCGRIQLGIRQKIMTQQQKNDFTESMKLKKMQAIVFTTELANALPIYLGLFGLLVVICLCAWLCYGKYPLLRAACDNRNDGKTNLRTDLPAAVLPGGGGDYDRDCVCHGNFLFCHAVCGPCIRNLRKSGSGFSSIRVFTDSHAFSPYHFICRQKTGKACGCCFPG